MAIVSLPPGIGEVQQYSGQQGRMPSRTPLASVAPPTGPLAAGEVAPPAASIIPTTTALDMAVALALGRQDGLSPVFAAAEALAARPDLPVGVRTVVEALRAMTLGSGGEPTGDDVAAAVRLSGAFHESLPTGAVDLKTILVALRAQLGAWIGVRPDLAADPATAGRPRPAPLGRGTPLRGQATVVDEDFAGLDTGMLARRLADGADRALWRLFLNQASRLQEDEQAAASGRPAETPAPTVVELPVTGPAGTAITGLRVEADDRRDGDGQLIGRVYRVELAFDLAPFGTVTARVGLMPGHRVAVGLWCDSAEASAALDEEREAIGTGLEAAGLAVAGIDLHVGRPPGGDERKAAGPAHRLDVSL